ncbi:hypothetical protein BH09VER1_BH09VER1_24410 [soil metagenome]
MKKARFLSRRASALVTTLLVITLLAIIVVAFLQSMSIESKTAKSFSNIARAQFAAEAAQLEATSRIASLMKANPYHAIGYTNIVDSGTTALVPILFGAPSGAGATNAAGAPKNHYLYSVANDTVPGTGLNVSNSTAVNRTNSDAVGWMGSPVVNGSIVYRECRAPWVYLLQNPNLPHQPDRSLANYNPYVSRYAWWVEDETSKVDIQQAGNADGTGGAFRSALTTNLFAATNNVFQDAVITKPGLVDLSAAPILDGLPIPTNAGGTNQAVISFRTNLLKLPRDSRILAQSILSTNSEVKSRFYTTLASVSDDLSGTGQRRANLNAIVTEGYAPNTIKSDLDDIIYVITGTHAYPNLNNSSDQGFFHDQADNNIALLPNFGERFWPSTDNRVHSPDITAAKKRSIYLLKIAANIRDYIDSDNMPTFVDKNGVVVSGADPGSGTVPPDGVFPSTVEGSGRLDELQPQAIGHEAIPYLVKTGWSFGSTLTDLFFDQYFSFYNPSTKSFTAPAGTFLRGYKRLIWNGGSFGQKQMAPFELNISGLVFPAGKVAVITTSPGESTDAPGGSYGAVIGGPGPVYRPAIQACPIDGSIVAGSRQAQEGTRIFSNVFPGSSYTIQPRGSSGHDWYTHMMWGNSHGYYGGYSGITITAVSNYGISGQNQLKGTAATMRGNDAGSHSGEAQSLQEPLALNDPYLTGSANGDQDQYRFYSSSSPTTLATVKNSLYLDPTGTHLSPIVPWPDYPWPEPTREFDDSINTSYAIIRDEPMTSIGELGNIYDPYRRNGNNAAGDNNTGYIDYARGGARTLRVGQPDDVIVAGLGRTADVAAAVNATRFTPAWANGAWHLTDVFDVVLDTSGTVQTVNQTNAVAPIQSLGKINVNSVLRDDGAAMRTLLRSFKFLSSTPSAAPGLSGQSLTDPELSGLIAQIKSYLTTKGPFLERGEMSQLAFFASTTPSGKDLFKTGDRGREEIFRRIVPMLTTRSSSFSVYAVAQAVREGKDGVIVPTAEAMKGAVYRINPGIGSGYRDTATNYVATQLYERF